MTQAGQLSDLLKRLAAQVETLNKSSIYHMRHPLILLYCWLSKLDDTATTDKAKAIVEELDKAINKLSTHYKPGKWADEQLAAESRELAHEALDFGISLFGDV